MPISDPSRFERYAAAMPERPTSFAERGVAVPFTAPMLAGARLRAVTGRPPEILLPALGGRGVYVLGWESCMALCAPTLHDRHLWKQLLRLWPLTPATVREASRTTALAGLAGRDAQAAARMARERFAEARARARRELLARLGPAAGQAAEARLARLLGALAETGLGPQPAAHLAARLAALEGLANALADPARGEAGADDRRAALLVAGAARLTLAAVQGSLGTLWQTLAQLPALFARGDTVMAEVATMAERPDWLLDGWAQLAALCATLTAEAPPSTRAALLREMVVRLPVPPLEADAWPGPVVDWEEVTRARHRMAPRPVLDGGSRVDLVARNERARSLAA